MNLNIKIVALFSFRYDKVLVPDLLKNIEGIVDDVIFYDDSNNEEIWYHEGETKRNLVEQAKDRGFDYVLWIDPDERLEINSGAKIRDLICKYPGKHLFDFNLREMWTPNSYRIDGIWGKKIQTRLFPLLPGQKFMNLKVHSPNHPINEDYIHINTELNIYHLKMIEAEARQERKILYKSLDPNRQIQKIGYDYLVDESNIKLENIPDNRGFTPPYDSSIKMVQTICPLYVNYKENKKILLTNHHLYDYAGSELVTLDLALDFKNRGWDVYVATFRYGGNMQKLFEQNNITVVNVLNDSLLVKEFDLVWGHHFPVLIKCLIEECIKTKSLVLSSLSPYEPLEAIPFFHSQSDLMLCNSEETKKDIIAHNINFDEQKLFVFNNSVPSNWFNLSLDRDDSELKKIAVISNHPTAEILVAIDILKTKKIDVDLIGISGSAKLVTIDLLISYDAVITIGRTVQHCMALGIPVFCYDHFGGPGWLTPDNFQSAEWFNYSGRCCNNRLTSEQIVENLINGFVDSKLHINFFINYAAENYSVTKNIDAVLGIISNSIGEEEKDYIVFNSEQVVGKVGKVYRRIFSEREILKRDLDRSQSQLIQTQQDLDRSQSQLIQTQQDLDRSQSQLIQTQQDLERSRTQLQQTQSELERSQSQLQQVNKNSQYYQNVIERMESSKFWKLRNAWFKMKSLNYNSRNCNNLTIIVPIFNAYKDTKKCLDSLLLYTDYRHKILLMDDASTDERIAELTQKLASQYSHITCLRNSGNFGFVRNCNIAFSKSEQTEDVVLLNSDTIVTPNWLEKLIVAAYSSSEIATVTPLTNNGTICSVPNWLEENEIPEGYDILSFATLIEKVSLRKYPKIPTAVGFCMYIKRETLKKVGYFDEIHFGKGYGEENDFCCRASNYGYCHIIDDSTFVYHAGSKSFGEKKQKLIEKNLAILSKLHPNYIPEVERFIADRPIQNIINNIELEIYIEKIKKLSPICFILHNSTEYPVNSHLGGTEYHCAALITELSSIHPIYTLYFNKYKSSISVNIFFEEKQISFEFSCQLPHIHAYLVQDTSFLNLFTDIVRYFQPAIIHIHHLISLPIVNISSVLKQENIPYLVSIHDYYFICPSYNLIDYQQQFCFEYKNEKYCQKCVQSLFSAGKDLKQKWSYICGKLLQDAELIIAPSATATSYLAREYTNISDKFRVIRHGIFTQQFIEEVSRNKVDLWTENYTNWNLLPLRVAFIGSININKGAKLIIELIERVNSQNDLQHKFEFYFFGSCSEEIPSQLTNVKINPPYERQDLYHILKDIDVVVFSPIWAETYCLTADEVLFCDVPIISSPIGAIAERVKEFGVGWVSPSLSSDDLMSTLLSVKNSPEDYKEVKINIDKYHVVSYKEMACNYLEEYRKIINANVVNQNRSAKSTLVLTPQDVFAAYNQDLNINQLSLRVPLSKKSITFSFLKKNFFGIWEFLRMLAIKFKLIK